MVASEQLEYLRALELRTESGMLLRDYCVHLVKGGFSLPSDKGDVNRSAVAAAIGRDRQVFYAGRGSKECQDLLMWAVEYIGIRRRGAAYEPLSAKLEGLAAGEGSVLLERLREAEKVISKLQRQVVERDAEIETLREENATLRKSLSTAEVVEEARLDGYEIIL